MKNILKIETSYTVCDIKQSWALCSGLDEVASGSVNILGLIDMGDECPVIPI